MNSAKDLRVAPIASGDAREFIKTHHYSGTFVRNSQLHMGAFLAGRLVGVASFGPPLDRRKLQGLVSDTEWAGFLELNRFAMIDNTPRNAESRFLSVAMRLLRSHAPHIVWVVSFADATRCGDGTIYRAAGFLLTGIKVNNQIWRGPGPDAQTVTRVTFTEDVVSRASMTMKGPNGASAIRRRLAAEGVYVEDGKASMASFRRAGWAPIRGFQLRYIYLMDPTDRSRLTVPVLPYSEIERRGASMYRGVARAGSIAADAPAIPAGEGGSTPTPALQSRHVGIE